MLKKIIYFFLFALAFSLVGQMAGARMNSASYSIWADVFSVGGLETGSSANFKIQDTIGEAIILSATSTSSNFGDKVGFREMYLDQYLTFTIADPTIDLGTLSDAAVASDSHEMVVNTNAVNGFNVTVTGSTLTSGANTIDAIGAAAVASTLGTEQFGINLVANSSPAIGADPGGTAPIGSAAGGYSTADQFAFNSGDTVASASSSVNQTTYTVSYLANIASDTEAGTYTTTLTYAATANF